MLNLKVNVITIIQGQRICSRHIWPQLIGSTLFSPQNDGYRGPAFVSGSTSEWRLKYLKYAWNTKWLFQGMNSKDQIEEALTKLSRQQRRTLLWLLKRNEILEHRMDQRGLEALKQGIIWNVGPASRSLRSSISRTLARLESRGLIERIAPNGRTIRVKITVLGKLVALRLKADSS